MTTMSEHSERTGADGRLLIGRVAEWNELVALVADRRGLTLLVADPWSGTSRLLTEAVAEANDRAAVVDARRCPAVVDLAMAIADEAVATFAPGARSWWLGVSPAYGTAGLRLARTLSAGGIGLEDLRTGAGDEDAMLRHALDLLAVLADGSALLAVDHLGTMLAGLRADRARMVLGAIRTFSQRHAGIDLLLVDHPGGPIDTALGHASHPLYRAGDRMRIRRPDATRFVDDLFVTRPMLQEPPGLLRAAAELAQGVPALTWEIVSMAPPTGEDAARAMAGWRALRSASEASVAREWDLLRRVHPAAQSVVGALSAGLPPHSVPVASKSVNDALRRLRDVGLAWQPADRRWAVSDPLLAAWARDHPSPWLARRVPGLAGRLDGP